MHPIVLKKELVLNCMSRVFLEVLVGLLRQVRGPERRDVVEVHAEGLGIPVVEGVLGDHDLLVWT
jgi:hypothetical protein